MASRGFIRVTTTILVTAALAAGGAAIVSAAGTGSANKDAAAVQYLTKPDCGPDKTDGVAGNSGQHTGQPPKAPNRQDCPSSPGQSP
jgi:hypothetical protein